MYNILEKEKNVNINLEFILIPHPTTSEFISEIQQEFQILIPTF